MTFIGVSKHRLNTRKLPGKRTGPRRGEGRHRGLFSSALRACPFDDLHDRWRNILAGKTRDRLIKNGEFHRLGEMFGEARLPAVFSSPSSEPAHRDSENRTVRRAPQPGQKLRATTVGETDIRDEDVELEALGDFEGLRDAGRGAHFMTLPVQQQAQALSGIPMVINHKNRIAPRRAGAAAPDYFSPFEAAEQGSLTINEAPVPGPAL